MLFPAADTHPPGDHSSLHTAGRSLGSVTGCPHPQARLVPLERSQACAAENPAPYLLHGHLLRACGPVGYMAQKLRSHVTAPREEPSWESAPDVCAAWFASGSRSPDGWDRQGLSGWTKIAVRRGERKDSERRLGPSRSRSGSRAWDPLHLGFHAAGWLCPKALGFPSSHPPLSL